jgi:hypothetical protein
MHTKRGNFWNELHKLDDKRIKLLLNKFVVKKDHEAMQYIIRNQERERKEQQGRVQQQQAKILEIKRSKMRHKTAKLKKLRDLEKKNFESVVRYLQDTLSGEALQEILKERRRQKKRKTRPAKENINKNGKVQKKFHIQIGSQKLFKKLSNLNNDIYERVYKETHRTASAYKPLSIYTGGWTNQ